MKNTKGKVDFVPVIVLNGIRKERTKQSKKERWRKRMIKGKQSKKDFNDYQNLMNQKFDWEDRKVKIFQEIRKLKNEDLHCSQQLRLVEDQLRLFFKRKRLEIEEECKNQK